MWKKLFVAVVLMVLAGMFGFAATAAAQDLPTGTHTGAFADGVACGTPGAQWRLYNCGTLVVDGGFVH